MTIELFYIILFIIFGILAYFHYIIDRQREEINIIWTQITILAASTAKKLTELKEQKTDDGKQ